MDNDKNYTIPKIKRELKPHKSETPTSPYYTIPKIKRELKRFAHCVI